MRNGASDCIRAVVLIGGDVGGTGWLVTAKSPGLRRLEWLVEGNFEKTDMK